MAWCLRNAKSTNDSAILMQSLILDFSISNFTKSAFSLQQQNKDTYLYLLYIEQNNVKLVFVK